MMITRLFGRQILQLIFQKVLKTLENDAKAHSRDFEKNYGTGAFRENVYSDEEVQVTAPRNPVEKKKVKVEEIAEEVDYEELK
jgi:hypothetical protein